MGWVPSGPGRSEGEEWNLPALGIGHWLRGSCCFGARACHCGTSTKLRLDPAEAAPIARATAQTTSHPLPLKQAQVAHQAVIGVLMQQVVHRRREGREESRARAASDPARVEA